MYPSDSDNPDDSAPLRHRTSSHLSPSAQDPSAQDLDDARSLRTTRLRRWLGRVAFTFSILLVLLFVALAIIAVSLRRDMRANLLTNQGLLDGNVPVSGLSAPVTITRDAQSVPSIHAANLDDLLFAQGYITAADRLFQMDALRRHGAGTLAEILGPSLIQHDREQRILQLRAAADRAVAVLPPDQLHQLQAYARGINAYISTHSGANTPNTLPVEFHILHYSPEPWQPRDSILIGIIMAQDLSTEFPTKLNREAFSASLPPNLVPDLYPVGSWRDHPPTQQPPDLTAPSAPVEQIPLDPTQSSINPQTGCDRVPRSTNKIGCPMSRFWDMGLQNASNLPPTLEPPPNPTPAAHAGLASPQDLLRIYADLRAHQCNGCRDGSNNWVVAGNHTATGAPLLSNDMHLGLTAPDIWYEAALHADGPTPLAVEGFTLPGVPFVIVGRNANIAWGFTNSGADVQDVLIEHLRKSGSETEYEHPDHTWSPVAHHTELIHVRAGRDVTLDVLTTTHTIGTTNIQTPIISALYPTEHRPLALAWTVYDPSTQTAPFLAINTATDAASLVAAFASFSSVSQNLVYADAHHIGYHLLGRIPIRGPATQRPRTTQPFILPNTTPPQDEQDESGDNPSASLPHPQAILASFSPTMSSSRPKRAARSGETPVFALVSTPQQSPSSRPERAARSGETPVFALVSTRNNAVILSAAQRSRRTPKIPVPPTPSTPSTTTVPTTPTVAYTIGSPLSPIPVDALDLTQSWSGYIPYDALPSVLDPTSGILATANARIAPDDYPYYISNNWADPYRVERINHLLDASVTANHPLTPADMLRIQMDVHSEFDLLVAQRLAYALDHSSLTHKDARLLQAANILRGWNGDVSADSPAAAITSAAYHEIWSMLLAPQLRDYANARYHLKLDDVRLTRILNLYTWDEDRTALEQLLQNTPARWLPQGYSNWNDLLAISVERGLHFMNAPRDLSTLTYGSAHPIDIAHPIFGSHSPISTMLGVATGSGFHPNGGDSTTVKAAGLHFGPSERFTADLADPDNTHANIPTGESGNPASPSFLDQFQPWLQGTTFTLPLTHPTIQHTLTLTPQ
ncbi:penicillin acylase family protein [Granulicella sp. L46]|uniref:penicillin acylase family protein n=1 Tax=Granulicella sp. L46 TaxID=1641865 RepID=UPI00131E2F2B|nr:penicillin acylase family protein [Granulicella sp. L46]